MQRLEYSYQLRSVLGEFSKISGNLLETPSQAGLAAAFDLAAYAGYVIARVKKSVNHSGIIQSMRGRSLWFLFRRHIGF